MSDAFDLAVLDGIDGETVVVLSGEIDVFSAPELRTAVVGLLDGGQQRLVLDLSRVKFVDSTGLGVLVGILKRLGSYDGASLSLREPSRQVMTALAATRLDQHFTIV